MLQKLPIYGYTLSDGSGIPRYWAAAWVLFVGGSLAPSTLKRHLTNIEALYVQADAGASANRLDDALGAADLALLEEILETFWVALRNVPEVDQTAQRRWRDAVAFVRDISERNIRTCETTSKFASISIRLSRLDRLYGKLRPTKKSPPAFIRALPASVLRELYDAVIPGSTTNPFKSDMTQWRVYAAFLLLLHQGIRRGEALSLPADFLKSERIGTVRQYWLNIRTNEYEDNDQRYTTPSIKTLNSIRQIPVSKSTAIGLMTYLENYRGRQNHSYFLSSARNLALSAEGLHYFFKVLSGSLTERSLSVLYERTGMTSISAHDLRHTSAVIRIKQLLASGDSMPEALQKMRSFFGWSANSPMPQLYAKAAFEERLNEVWGDEFDDRTAMISVLPQ
jgi:integrase